jgi:hypothetical protein
MRRKGEQMSNDADGQALPFEQMQQLVFDFEQALNDVGIKEIGVKSGSALEAACLDAIRVRMLQVDPNIQDNREDVRKVFRHVLGLWTLMNKTIRLKSKNGFEAFHGHFKMLNDGVVWQNEKYVVGDQAADKLFELVFGLAVLDIADEVDVDDPVHSSGGTNPDILAVINGVRWGFACKVLRGESGKALVDNLFKAVDQIEKSKADIGIPVINLANLLPHDFFWPMLNQYEWEHEGQEPRYFTWPSKEAVFRRAREFATSHRLKAEIEVGLPPILDMYLKKKSLKGYLAYMQTCCGVVRNSQPVPSDLRDFSIQDFWPAKDNELDVLKRLHLALHDRLKEPNVSNTNS